MSIFTCTCILFHPGTCSLVPRLLWKGRVEPGTHCLHMRKNLWKKVGKCICKRPYSRGKE